MQTANALIVVEQPVRLMNRLCKHWAHKFPVNQDERQGEITLPMGVCRMHCSDVLEVELETTPEQMSRLQQVVADHLQRMAGKETLVIEWR